MVEESSSAERVRTAEKIAALSLATDLPTGVPVKHGLHCTLNRDASRRASAHRRPRAPHTCVRGRVPQGPSAIDGGAAELRPYGVVKITATGNTVGTKGMTILSPVGGRAGAANLGPGHGGWRRRQACCPGSAGLDDRSQAYSRRLATINSLDPLLPSGNRTRGAAQSNVQAPTMRSPARSAFSCSRGNRQPAEPPAPGPAGG